VSDALNLTRLLSDPDAPLPNPANADAVAEQVVALHERSAGVTLSLFFGDVAGRNFFAVSLFPERSLRLPGRFVPLGLLRSFVRRNQTFVDVASLLSDREEAAALAQQYNQIAFFDLAESREIVVGGSGEAGKDFPPEAQRLPPRTRRPARND